METLFTLSCANFTDEDVPFTYIYALINCDKFLEIDSSKYHFEFKNIF